MGKMGKMDNFHNVRDNSVEITMVAKILRNATLSGTLHSGRLSKVMVRIVPIFKTKQLR